MSVKDDYQRIALRSLEAADVTLAEGLHEKAAFMSYHAFESTGCALASHMSRPVGGTVRHNTKLDHFRIAAGRIGREREVARMAAKLAGLRNSCLYPIEAATTGSYTLPENAVTAAQANELRKRIGGIVTWVGKAIS